MYYIKLTDKKKYIQLQFWIFRKMFYIVYRIITINFMFISAITYDRSQ